MSRPLALRRLLSLLLLVVPILLVAGCGGDDHYYYDDYPYSKDLTLVLRVQSPGGSPIGGASVLIDGEADEVKTDAEFHPLGSGYPDAWQGWLANWTSDAYEVVMNYSGDEDEFEIRVHKDGWIDDTTIVAVSDSEPNHIFVRDTMVLRRPADTSAARGRHYAEVVGAPAGLKLSATPALRKVIAASDDSNR